MIMILNDFLIIKIKVFFLAFFCFPYSLFTVVQIGVWTSAYNYPGLAVSRPPQKNSRIIANHSPTGIGIRTIIYCYVRVNRNRVSFLRQFTFCFLSEQFLVIHLIFSSQAISVPSFFKNPNVKVKTQNTFILINQ